MKSFIFIVFLYFHKVGLPRITIDFVLYFSLSILYILSYATWLYHRDGKMFTFGAFLCLLIND